MTKEELLERALEDVNRMRVRLGGEPLAAMPMGHTGRDADGRWYAPSESCALSVALWDVGVERVGYAAAHHVSGEILPMTQAMTDFAVAFDGRRYPELIAYK